VALVVLAAAQFIVVLAARVTRQTLLRLKEITEETALAQQEPA
jgi:hypothetical protein